MDFLKKNKLMIGGAIVVVLAITLYFMYFSGGSSTPALSSPDEVSPISQSLLVSLQNLHTIKLDSTIFQNPVFLSLTDFGVTIPPENVGRRNPFAPLAGSAPAAKSGQSVPPAGK